MTKLQTIDLKTAQKIFNRVGAILTANKELIERDGTTHILTDAIATELQRLAFKKGEGAFQATKNYYRDNPYPTAHQYTIGKDAMPGQFAHHR